MVPVMSVMSRTTSSRLAVEPTRKSASSMIMGTMSTASLPMMRACTS